MEKLQLRGMREIILKDNIKKITATSIQWMVKNCRKKSSQEKVVDRILGNFR